MLSLRIELKTSRLLNECSKQLSYESGSLIFLLKLWTYYLQTKFYNQQSKSPKVLSLDSCLLNNQLIHESTSFYHASIDSWTQDLPLTKHVL